MPVSIMICRGVLTLGAGVKILILHETNEEQDGILQENILMLGKFR